MAWLDELIDGAVNAVTDVTDATQEAIDAAVHRAAVGLLDAILPALIHGGDAVVKAAAWAPMAATAAKVTAALHVAQAGDGVLAGMVERKVAAGVGELLRDGDYLRGVNGITL